MKIVIVDYGMGNVQSVNCALERLGSHAKLSCEPERILEADALILPGVGAFGKAVENLTERGLLEPLRAAVIDNKAPILGICLGMQLFADSSSEMGSHKGFGWIPGRVVSIDAEANGLSLPHVGWNDVAFSGEKEMFRRISFGENFYFDHSFHFDAAPKFVECTSSYGEEIVAGVRREHIWGVQFHPEKSQTAGLKLIRNFLNYCQEKQLC